MSSTLFTQRTPFGPMAAILLRTRRSCCTSQGSAGLLVDVPRYFAALSAFRRGDAGPIVAEFAPASRIAASTGTRLVRGILTETTGRARCRVWQYPVIFRVLDGYAAEIQRMSSHPA